MSGYKSTTSIPQERIRSIAEISYDNTDGANKDVWVPADSKKVYINDVVLSVINKDASGYIIVAVQVYAGGSWRTLVPLTVGPQSGANFSHNFGQRLRSAEGDGSTEMIRVVRLGTSTSWEAYGVVTGEEI